MCRQNGAMDEVWEAASSDEESGSEVDSDGDSVVGGMTQPTSATSPPACSSGTRTSSVNRMEKEQPPNVSKTISSTSLASVSTAASSPLAAKQQVGLAKTGVPTIAAAGARPQQQGVLTLMAHLRKDNDKLRQALVDAQRDAEEAVLENDALREREDAGAIDFGHLLALAKEFGDGLGGGLGEDAAGVEDALGSVQCFSLDSPRDAPGADGKERDSTAAADLRRQLDESRSEVEQLKAMLAAKDAELAEARRLASPVAA